jgi:hypothetical protein
VRARSLMCACSKLKAHWHVILKPKLGSPALVDAKMADELCRAAGVTPPLEQEAQGDAKSAAAGFGAMTRPPTAVHSTSYVAERPLQVTRTLAWVRSVLCATSRLLCRNSNRCSALT